MTNSHGQVLVLPIKDYSAQIRIRCRIDQSAETLMPMLSSLLLCTRKDSADVVLSRLDRKGKYAELITLGAASAQRFPAQYSPSS